jgi:hypothetical protein
LSEELLELGYEASNCLVHTILSDLNYTLNLKQRELFGKYQSLSNDQFEFINERIKRAFKKGNPVIFVERKKSEVLGTTDSKEQNFHEDHAKVDTHDFYDPNCSKANTNRLYNLGNN